MSVHQLKKVLFVLRPKDRTNGEAVLLTFLAWDAHHNGTRWRTSVRRLAELTAFRRETVRNALNEFERRGWMAITERGARGAIKDWRLTLPAKLELGSSCGKNGGKAVGQLRISPLRSPVQDPVQEIDRSRVGDPSISKKSVSDGAAVGSGNVPSFDPSLDPSTTEQEKGARSAVASSPKLHFESADSDRTPEPPNQVAPPQQPDVDVQQGQERLRLVMARIAALPTSGSARQRRAQWASSRSPRRQSNSEG